MKEKIEAYLRGMKPLDSIGKWALAEAIDHHSQTWDHAQIEAFEKALRSVVRKLRKEKILHTWGDWLHRD